MCGCVSCLMVCTDNQVRKGGKEECNAAEGYFRIHGKKIHGVDIVRALTAAGKIYQRIVVLVDVCYSSSLFQSLTPKNHKGITVFTCGEEDEQCYMAKWTRNVTSGSLFNRRLVLFTIALAPKITSFYTTGVVPDRSWHLKRWKGRM